MTQVRHVARLVRSVVRLEALRRLEEVAHYSIPAWDELRGPIFESPGEIESDKQSVSSGDVLISRLNPRKSRVARIGRHEIPAVASTEFVAYRPVRIEGRYLAYLFAAESTRQHLDAHVQSVTRSQQRVEQAVISRVEVPVYGLGDQRRIADFLDRESARISAARGGVLAAGKPLTLLEQAEVDRFGAGRERWRLSWVASVQSGLTLGAKYPQNVARVRYPYLRVANVQADEIDTTDVAEVEVPESVAERSLLRDGDVLLTEGGDIDKLGRGAVWRARVEPCLHQNHVFAIRCGPRYRPEFLAAWSRSTEARTYFESTASRITNIASTNATKLKAFRVPALTLMEQDVRLEKLERIRRATNEARRSLLDVSSRLDEYRDALINEAVAGHLDASRLSEAQMEESLHAASEGERPEVLAS